MKRWKNKRGETLAESLLAILITALAASVFLSFAAISTNLIDKSDDQLVKSQEGCKLTVSVKRKGGGYRNVEELPVTVYYSDEIAAYQLEEDSQSLQEND